MLARTATLNRLQADMNPGSAFLRYLESIDPRAGYELYPYVRLGDGLVGERYAAPPGRNPLWLTTPALPDAHAAWHDPRILADIARRLRGEPPFSSMPPAPVPEPDAQSRSED